MSVSVVSRPEETIVRTPNVYYTAGEFVSQWNCAYLPIQYILSSNRYPVNNVDSSQNITAVTDVNGFATLAVASHGYNIGDYVTVSGTTSYNGVFQVTSVPTAGTFTINTAFVSDQTGTVIKYYNNYVAKVKVYSGLPVTHPLSAERPVEVVATLSLVPDSNNQVRLDLSQFIREQLKPEPPLSLWMGNDLNAWNSFYISYTESYDQGTSTTELVIENVEPAYTVDVDAEYLQRIFYGTYSALPYGSTYGGNMGIYACSTTDGLKAKFLTQFDTPILWRGNVSQDISIILDKELTDLADNAPIYFEYRNVDANGGQDPSWNSEQIKINGEGLYRLMVNEFDFLETTKFTKVRISGPEFRQYGTRSNVSSGGTVNWSIGNPSTASGAGNQVTNVLYHPITLEDGWKLLGQKVVVRLTMKNNDTDPCTVIVSLSNGTTIADAAPSQTLAASSTVTYTLELTNTTFNGTLSGVGIQAADIGNLGLDVELSDVEIYLLLPKTETLTLESDCFNTFQEFVGESDFAGYTPSTTNGATISNATGNYIITTSNSGDIATLKRATSASNAGIAYDVSVTINVTSGTLSLFRAEFSNLPWPSELNLTGVNTFNYTQTPTGADEFTLIFAQIGASPATVEITDFLVVSQTEPITVCKASCGRYSYYIKWLNKLGGWEYWEFYTEENVSFDVSDVKTVTQDKWINWPEGFKSNERQYKRTGITVRKRQNVSSQFLTLGQIQGMESLKYTPQAYLINSDGSQIPIQIEAGSFDFYNTTDKLYTIEFDILFNDTIVQQ